MTVKYLAIDPGETIGWATFTHDGEINEYGQVRMENFTDWAKQYITEDLLGVICEDYKNHGWTQQKKWGRNETSQIIGKIELMCDLHGIKLHFQPNTVKRIGYMWSGLGNAPSNHKISHQFDAIAHGVYWLVKNSIRKLGEA